MATISEAVIKEIEEKSIKENRSLASILRERGIKYSSFYNRKRRLEIKEDVTQLKRNFSPPAVMVVKAADKTITQPSGQLSLMQTLEYLKAATENLERIFKGFKQ